MLKEENVTVAVCGSIGNDHYGRLYKELLEKEKVAHLFEEIENNNTGVCCVFCCQRDRGHLTDLGASILISKKFVEKILEEHNEGLKLIFTELFILKHKKDIVYMLAEYGMADEKIFGFNLPSFYFIETFFEDIKLLFEYVDIVFCNIAEAYYFYNLLTETKVKIKI
jgi:sugar/nucleoside kinase (ribokinase family)